MMISSKSRFIKKQTEANDVPMAKEPVSPMKIFAGAAFHHRNPRQAPTNATAMSPRSKDGESW